MSEVKQKVPANLFILKLSFSFFSMGLLIYLIGMIMMFWFFPELVESQSLRSPKGWFLAHLFLLGWATMVAMGASFQITQVILRTSIYSRAMGYIQFVLFGIGFIVLILGLLNDMFFAIVGGVSILIGIIIYVWNISVTCIKKREWNTFVFGISLSLIQLVFTVSLGVTMGLGFSYGWFSEYHESLFLSHLWLGMAGWLSGLIIIYSLKLLPMFYVSKKKLSTLAYWMIGAYHLGIWLQVVAVWSKIIWIGIAATLSMVVAIVWYNIHIFAVRKQSSGKQPIGVVKVAFYLIPAISLLFLLWILQYYVGRIFSKANEVLLISITLGWFTASILSYLSKIFPFLWWAYRFRTKEEKKSAVLLSVMLPEKRMTWELWGYLIGVIVVVCGYIIQSTTMAMVGQIGALLFVLVYIVELLRVFRF